MLTNSFVKEVHYLLKAGLVFLLNSGDYGDEDAGICSPRSGAQASTWNLSSTHSPDPPPLPKIHPVLLLPLKIHPAIHSFLNTISKLMICCFDEEVRLPPDVHIQSQITAIYVELCPLQLLTQHLPQYFQLTQGVHAGRTKSRGRGKGGEEGEVLANVNSPSPLPLLPLLGQPAPLSWSHGAQLSPFMRSSVSAARHIPP